MNVKPHHPLTELQKLYRTESNARLARRIHGIYLADRNGQSVIGYCAADVGGKSGLKLRLRETAARFKAVLDVMISKNPKYLGAKEQMNYRIRE